MIKLGEDYTITSDPNQLILNTKRVGEDKDGNPKDFWSQTYHATFEQIGRTIINGKMNGMIRNEEAQSLSQFMEGMYDWSKEFAAQIENSGEEA